MKQISIILLCCLLMLAAYAQGGKPLTLKDVVTGTFRVENIYGVIPIPGDGEHYSQMNAEGTQIIKYSFKTGKLVEVLFDAATAREYPFKRFDSYSESQVTKDGERNKIIYGTPDWMYEEAFSYNRALEFSADSKILALVR